MTDRQAHPLGGRRGGGFGLAHLPGAQGLGLGGQGGADPGAFGAGELARRRPARPRSLTPISVPSWAEGVPWRGTGRLGGGQGAPDLAERPPVPVGCGVGEGLVDARAAGQRDGRQVQERRQGVPGVRAPCRGFGVNPDVGGEEPGRGQGQAGPDGHRHRDADPGQEEHCRPASGPMSSPVDGGGGFLGEVAVGAAAEDGQVAADRGAGQAQGAQRPGGGPPGAGCPPAGVGGDDPRRRGRGADGRRACWPAAAGRATPR